MSRKTLRCTQGNPWKAPPCEYYIPFLTYAFTIMSVRPSVRLSAWVKICRNHLVDGKGFVLSLIGESRRQSPQQRQKQSHRFRQSRGCYQTDKHMRRQSPSRQSPDRQGPNNSSQYFCRRWKSKKSPRRFFGDDSVSLKQIWRKLGGSCYPGVPEPVSGHSGAKKCQGMENRKN